MMLLSYKQVKHEPNYLSELEIFEFWWLFDKGQEILKVNLYVFNSSTIERKISALASKNDWIKKLRAVHQVE